MGTASVQQRAQRVSKQFVQPICPLWQARYLTFGDSAHSFSVRIADDVLSFLIESVVYMGLSAIEVGLRMFAENVLGLMGDFDYPHGFATGGAAERGGLFSNGLRSVPAGQPVHPAEKQGY